MNKDVRPIIAALQDPDTYTLVLLAILLEQYGTEATQWTPETIFLELKDDFGVTLPRQNKDQLVVGLNLLTSDDFYKRLPVFIQAANVLSGSRLSTTFDKADAAECAWGITEAMLISPPEPDDPQPFSEEILHYLGEMLDAEGVLTPPPMLQAAIRLSPVAAANISDIPTEDPEMFATTYGVRADKTQQLDEMLQENLSALLHQLATLPGMQDSVDRLVSELRRASQGLAAR